MKILVVKNLYLFNWVIYIYKALFWLVYTVNTLSNSMV